MAAPFRRFNVFSEDLATGVHNLRDDVLAIYLTNAAPDFAAHRLKADLAEISIGNGYGGPIDTQNSVERLDAITRIIGVDIAIANVGPGVIGPFVSAVLCNLSVAGQPLIGCWSRESETTIEFGDSPFLITFGLEMFRIGE